MTMLSHRSLAPLSLPRERLRDMVLVRRNENAVLDATNRQTLVWREAVTKADIEPIRSLVAGTAMFTPAEVDIAIELITERLAKGSASGYEFVIAEDGGRL